MTHPFRLDRPFHGFAGSTAFAVVLLAAAGFLSPLFLCTARAQNWQDVPAYLRGSAVWNPPAVQVEQLRRSCWTTEPLMSAACLADRMGAAGASQDAVLLSSRLHEGGFLQRLDTVNGVFIAWFNMPFRHNDNHVLVMVDSQGRALDGGDASDIPREQLLSDERYAALYARYPSLAVWPSDRAPENDLFIERFPKGGMRIILEFRVMNGCRACPRVGYLRVAWYFTEEGVFRGKKFVGVYENRESQGVD